MELTEWACPLYTDKNVKLDRKEMAKTEEQKLEYCFKLKDRGKPWYDSKHGYEVGRSLNLTFRGQNKKVWEAGTCYTSTLFNDSSAKNLSTVHVLPENWTWDLPNTKQECVTLGRKIKFSVMLV